MRCILVTGGAGFIGSNFIRYMLGLGNDIRIINVDALTYAGHLSNLDDLPEPRRHKFIHGNITDAALINRIFQEEEIDTVIHFAAESHVDRSIIRPIEFVETNVTGTLVLLQAALEAWRENQRRIKKSRFRFHHISTDEVFGSLNPGDSSFTETSRYDPRSPYAASKAGSDHLVRSFHHTYQLPITISHCSNNYGPYQHPEKLIPQIIINGSQGKEIPIYGDGLQIRDWIHVVDHCYWINQIIEHGEPGCSFNIGGDNQFTNLDLTLLVCDMLDQLLPESPNQPHRNLIRHVADRPGHDRRYAMDTGFIHNRLGNHELIDLSKGIAQTVEWYLDNPQWVARIFGSSEYAEWTHVNYEKRNKINP